MMGMNALVLIRSQNRNHSSLQTHIWSAGDDAKLQQKKVPALHPEAFSTDIWIRTVFL